MKKSIRLLVFVIAVTFCINLTAPLSAQAAGSMSLSDKGYTLKQVIVLSRHNIRSPLSTKGSDLETATPYEWYKWSSGASELSLRGGVLETEMGQYFKEWLESEGLIPENYHPEGSEVRFYSNSKQRTIATAKYFSAGFLPTANIDIEYHVEFDKMDPVFTPDFNFLNDEYIEAADAQAHQLFNDAVANLDDNYELLVDVIDMYDTDKYADYNFENGFNLSYAIGQEPKVSGSLKLATSISDALVLQYYEEADHVKAAFGNDLTLKQWEDISEIKTVYGDILFTVPLIATNVANPLVKEIYSEMNTEGRVFTFLCGHDSNIGSVLAALGVKDYELPDTIEKKAPIGCKIVFSKWENKKGKAYWSVDLVYQSVDQLQEQPLLDLKNEPVVYHLSFNGIKQNKDGLYKEKAIKKLFKNSMKEYDDLYLKYSDVVAFLGPEGTYTQEACEKFFGNDDTLVPYKTVGDAVQALVDKRAKYAVIPQENTIGGAVVDYVDTLIAEPSVSVAGEVELTINQNLLAAPGTKLSDIKTVYSHKQGIAQGTEWLKKNLPNSEVIEVSSTAEGARLVSEANKALSESGDKNTYAAIASAGCADVYGLEILAEGIQGNENNKTRFYVLSLDKPSTETKNRLAFIAKGSAKELPSLISGIEKQGMTLVTIHDRPLKTVLGEYYYLIECSDCSYESYLNISKNNKFEFRFLGCF
ncbi:MAG: histidine-type phosphatase [Lachnospiraceae bacterium]|nr:histidine-type phosphatase [Lachnospiraceae bacterium]